MCLIKAAGHIQDVHEPRAGGRVGGTQDLSAIDTIRLQNALPALRVHMERGIT